MPLYEYECEICSDEKKGVKVVLEAYRSVNNRDVCPFCEKCGEIMLRRLPSGIHGKIDAPYYHEGFGEVVQNKRHFKELQRKHNACNPEDHAGIVRSIRGKKKDYKPGALTRDEKKAILSGRNYLEI